MADLPLALALGAGMLAAVNPCGFALLPAYLSLLVLGDDSPSRTVAVGRALAATAAMTAGFATFFGVFGLLIQPVAGQIQQHLPWFTIVLGLLIATAGAWLLAGRQLSTFAPKLRRAPTVTRSVPSMALFGTAYATASLGCTIAPFLAIVVSAFRSGSTTEGILLFAAYAAGMGLIVGVASLTVALTRTTAVTRLRRLGAIAPPARRRSAPPGRRLRRLLRLVRDPRPAQPHHQRPRHRHGGHRPASRCRHPGHRRSGRDRRTLRPPAPRHIGHPAPQAHEPAHRLPTVIKGPRHEGYRLSLAAEARSAPLMPDAGNPGRL
ncbi:cytochrome c biogenesis CcdA family protein [Streptomyces sp. 11x1]|uniref:cytochrome c biogenesis CcdA family protein n=1 Tax=Streptomyces sp. 11x1 TaxID=3038642 RepID=UPI002931C132|nr:cytochrome c biogenesis CcdA family protein [Streptomyces sp. 11x1]WNZ06482.1 cytochrome c biogenesis CcdA family protein [Streptomyces sp. 11x1]